MGFGRIFLFIFVFALLEAMLLAKVAQLVGWGTTVLLVVATAMIGSMLLRRQGLATWMRLNQRMQQGEMPAAELVEGVLLLLGGVLLITPGFISDSLGLLLLLPPLRKPLAALMMRRGVMQAVSMGGRSSAWVYTRGSYQGTPPAGDQKAGPQTPPPGIYEDRNGNLIIDGEAERKDD